MGEAATSAVRGQLGASQLLESWPEHVGGGAGLDGCDQAGDLVVGVGDRSVCGLEPCGVLIGGALSREQFADRLVDVVGIKYGGSRRSMGLRRQSD